MGRNVCYRIVDQENPPTDLFKGGQPWRTGVSHRKRNSIFKCIYFFFLPWFALNFVIKKEINFPPRCFLKSICMYIYTYTFDSCNEIYLTSLVCVCACVLLSAFSCEPPRSCDWVLMLKLLSLGSKWKAFHSPISLTFLDSTELSALQSAWSSHTRSISFLPTCQVCLCFCHLHNTCSWRSWNDFLSFIHWANYMSVLKIHLSSPAFSDWLTKWN